MPRTPRTAMRRAMMPPQTALVCPGGCSMTTKLPGSVASAQCVCGGRLGAGEAGWPLAANRTVDTGATVLSPPRPPYGRRSATKPAAGTSSLRSASETSQAVNCASCAAAAAGSGAGMARDVRWRRTIGWARALAGR
ncbi:hypothetical protein CDD83_5005 [Cordyceps sp. RAO-2017]|nr:hypothetical protein CDD83_5005 [Cordyceps sp. RAO-2017]